LPGAGAVTGLSEEAASEEADSWAIAGKALSNTNIASQYSSRIFPLPLARKAARSVPRAIDRKSASVRPVVGWDRSQFLPRLNALSPWLYSRAYLVVSSGSRLSKAGNFVPKVTGFRLKTSRGRYSVIRFPKA
jgi:hypothetical protein